MPKHIGETKGEFSVYWWPKVDEENYVVDKRWVGAEEAVQAARRLTHGPLAQMGGVEKVMVTNGDDTCTFHWEKGKLLFPTQEERLRG